MASLSESNITSQFTSQSVNLETLSRCAHKNGQGNDPAVYVIYSCGFLYDHELKELFGITERLKDTWERRGTDFNVYLYIKDGKILRCEIHKYHEGDGARPSCADLKCTQQELRVAKRILCYVTEK